MNRESLILASILAIYVAFQLLVVYVNFGGIRVSALLLLILFIIIYEYIRKGSFARRYQLSMEPKYLYLGLLLFASVYLLVMLVTALGYMFLGALGEEEIVKQITSSPDIHSNSYLVLQTIKFVLSHIGFLGIILVVLFLFAVAYVEEILFRGILFDLFFQVFSKHGNPEIAFWAANIFQALIFTSLHLISWNLSWVLDRNALEVVVILYLVPLFLMGIVLEIGRKLTRSLAPSIVAHFCYDSLAILILLRSIH